MTCCASVTMWFCATILIGAVSLLGFAWAAFRISNRHVIRLCRAIHRAEPSYPILGNILMFACSQEEMTKNWLDVVEKSVLEGHRAVCFWIGGYPLVFVTDPDDIKKVLNSTLHRGKEVEESCKEYSKYGLFTAPVDHWKITRRHLNLSFHPRHLQHLMPPFNLASRKLVSELSENADDVVNLMPYVMSAALRSVSTFIYGTNAMDRFSREQFEELKHAVEVAADLLALRVSRPWLRNEKIFKFLYGKEINSIKSFCRAILDMEKSISAEREQTESDADDENGTDGKFDNDFQPVLNAMRELQKKISTITDEHVTDEMSSFFLSGSDSIGASVSSCLLALAKFDNIQAKVHEEICSVLSPEDLDVSYADLRRFTYLEQVVKETLRFFTVAPATARAPTKDVDLGGYILPANKTAIMCTSAACIDPKYFPDPDRFDPDRFSEPNTLQDSVFMPFSRGPRGCVGKEYAMMLIKVMVIHVIRKYRLSTNMDIRNLKKKYMLTLTLCEGYNVSLSNRSE